MRGYVLTSPLFVASLAVLLLNDFFLKRAMPGFVTGKLSDYAGLFAFTVFWLAFFPRRAGVIAAMIAIAFVIWKLPLAQPAIDFWNAQAPFAIGRTVDPTDLLALIVLPFAMMHVRRATPAPRNRLATTALIFASAFAFAATSRLTGFEYGEAYRYSGAPEELVAKLKNLGIDTSPTAGGKVYGLDIPADMCTGVYAEVTILPRDGATHLVLQRLSHHCPERRGEKAKLHDVFTTSVVKPLGLTPVR